MSEARPFPLLSDFVGVVYLPAPGFERKLSIGWSRLDFPWDEIEPQKGVWRWEKFDMLVLEAHWRGLEILPILCYTARWAATSLGPFGPPRSVKDWEEYVERVVSRYSKPPFYLRYFQVWNEPTRKAGFWKGRTEEEWVDKIFIPAARIIRRHKCFVVFGGWPCSDGLDKLDRILTYRECWRLTDIIDIHYYEMRSWQRIYDRWIAPGFCKGIWQTEIGFLTFPNYLPNAYLRGLYWALKHRWDFPEKYKLFWFAFWGAGKDAPKCLTYIEPGKKLSLSEHGKRLSVMAELLGGGRLRPFDRFSLDIPLEFTLHEEKPTAMGFEVEGRRVVVALILPPDVVRSRRRLILRLKPKGPVSGAMLVSADGSRRLPLRFERSGEILQVGLPVKEIPPQLARHYGRKVEFAICYVALDKEEKKS